MTSQIHNYIQIQLALGLFSGEGDGTPLQYSCLENPMDEGAWKAAVHCITESDMIEWLHFHFSLSCIGEGNGNPLQCSCLENPRDEGAWWAAVYGVTQSQTRLKWLSSSSSSKQHWKICFIWHQKLKTPRPIPVPPPSCSHCQQRPIPHVSPNGLL